MLTPPPQLSQETDNLHHHLLHAIPSALGKLRYFCSMLSGAFKLSIISNIIELVTERVKIKNQVCVITKATFYPLWAFLGFPDGSVGKASTCNAGDPSSIPGSGRSPGEG